MKYYRIKNWDKYQHYHKGRGAPPWVKLHTKIIQGESWLMATDAQRLHMLCCLCVGALNNGCVPSDPRLIKRLCHLHWRVEIEPLIELGFLENVLADASTLLAKVGLEAESEAEEETESEAAPEARGAPPSVPGKKQEGAAAPAAGFAEFWLAYPKKVSKPAAIRAFKQAIKRVSLEQMLEALNAQKRTWRDPQYIKNPSTWLNNDCWNDEVVKTPEWSSIV